MPVASSEFYVNTFADVVEEIKIKKHFLIHSHTCG